MNKKNIILAAISIATLLLAYPVLSIVIWFYELFLAYMLATPLPSYSDKYFLHNAYSNENFLQWLIISILYIAMFLLPVAYAFFWLKRKQNFKYLAIVPLYFFVSIITGNIFEGFFYHHFDFNIFRPVYKYYHTHAGWEFLDWVIFLAGYIFIPLMILGFSLKFRKKVIGDAKPKTAKQYKSQKVVPNGKYGSAKLADKRDLKALDFIHSNRKALQINYIFYVIGKLTNKDYIGSKKLENTIVVGRRGSGKGTSGSILTLLETLVNCLVNDTKGELFMTTFEERIRMGKNPIAADITRELDQFNNFREHMCLRFNPLWCDFLKDANLIRKSQYLDAIVSALIMDTDDPREKHWVGKGRTVLRGFMTIMLEENLRQHRELENAIEQISDNEFAYPDKKEQVVYSLDDLDDGDIVLGLDGQYKIVKDFKLEEYDEILAKKNLIDVKMQYIKAGKDDLQGILEKANKELKSPIIDEALGTLTQAGKDNELGGILTTLNDSTSMLSNPSTAHFFRSPRKNDIQLDINDFLTGMTDIYIVCGVDELKQYPQLLSIFINLIRVSIKFISRKDKYDEYLFLFDEIGQLGYLPCIETIDSIGRDLGFIQHLYFQTMDQIDKYKAKNMLKGFEVQRFFKTTEENAIRYVTYLAGKSTIKNPRKSTSKNSGSLFNKQTTSSNDEIGVDLITVDQLRTLPKNEQYVFIHGEVVRCNVVHYFEDPKYEGKYGINYAYPGNKHLCIPYTKPDDYEVPENESDELHFNDSSDIKKKFTKMVEGESPFVKQGDGYHYIDQATLEYFINGMYPSSNISNIIDSLVDANILTLVSLDDEHVYKINTI